MKRIVIVGGGAAGLMAGIWAAGKPLEVIVVERSAKPGRKILIAGGGRCNVLPSTVSPDQYYTASSRNTFKKIFLSWPLAEQRRFFEETLGVPLKVETETGKVFPASDRAGDILTALLHELRRRGGELRVDCSVESLVPPNNSDGTWSVGITGGESIKADAVVMASGGKSVPKTGSDGTGLTLMEKLGLKIETTFPALTPLCCDVAEHQALAGLSLDVTLMAPEGDSVKRGDSSRGGFLFTHQGYSGPSVLNMSHYAVQARDPNKQHLWVQWSALDETAWETLLLKQHGKSAGGLRALLREKLPTRLVELLLVESGVKADSAAALTREERQRLVRLLSRYPLPYNGDEGYKKAEVTGGGVALAEVDPATLEVRGQRQLFLCGEILDAFGPIGGYNFCWAWATGKLAGLGARQKLLNAAETTE